MSDKSKPKLQKVAQRWVNGELSASQLRRELQSKYADNEAVWEQLANEVETIRNKPQRSWRPLILNLLKFGAVILVVAALIFLGWQWQQVNDRLARLEATPAATQVAVATPVSPQPEASPTHTPTPEPTAPPQPRIDEITFGDVPARLYVHGDEITVFFEVEGQLLEGEIIQFSLIPMEMDTEIVEVSKITDGAGSLSLKPGNKVGTVAIQISNAPNVKDLPLIEIMPIPNIAVSIESSASSIDEERPVTYELILTNNGGATIFNIQAHCRRPPELKFVDDSISAQDMEGIMGISWKPIESMEAGGSQKYLFEASLVDDGTDSTGPVVCQVTAEGLKESKSAQSSALTIVRQQIEIRNVIIDPPYMATRIESTITAEIWQGEQPLTEGVTVTVTAEGAEPASQEVNVRSRGVIGFTLTPQDAQVGEKLNFTVTYEAFSNTKNASINPSLTFESTPNLRIGPSSGAITVSIVQQDKKAFVLMARSGTDEWKQICCVGDQLVWVGNVKHDLYPNNALSLIDPIEMVFVGSPQRIYNNEDKQFVLLSGFSDESNKRAMVEKTESGSVRLRGWIDQDNIDLATGIISRNDDDSLPKLILSLVDSAITVQFEGNAIGFKVEVVSTRPVGPNSDLIPIIVEGYLGDVP